MAGIQRNYDQFLNKKITQINNRKATQTWPPKMKKSEGSIDNSMFGYFKSVVGISSGDTQVERLDSISV
jgi:hypothetical protein